MLASRFERRAIENLMRELSEEYSIIIVTHNMQQAAFVSNFTALLMAEVDRLRHPVKDGRAVRLLAIPQTGGLRLT